MLHCSLFLLDVTKLDSSRFCSTNSYAYLAFNRHLHDDVILLILPEYFRVSLSCANQGFCYLNLNGINKFKYQRKNEMNSGLSSKRRHRDNGVFWRQETKLE